ncbi:MAG: AmmeMemoRadiSam system radical SAM enzyme [Terriglobia bacterium]
MSGQPMSTSEPATLQEILERKTIVGSLYEPLADNRVRCFACGHRCVILDGLPGICKVRFNQNGTLYVPYGYVAALQCDPVEKKPFFHALPGADALSFGMLGCDYHCGYCQNWITSQALRDPKALAPAQDTSIDELLQLANRYQAKILASTYNEPLITTEWAVAIFQRAKQKNLKTAYISNGNGTSEVLDYIQPWVDLYKVDLKGFRDRNYRKLGGRLEGVLETIRQLHQKRFWVEVVTLIVPGFNDSDEELKDIAQFLAGVSPDIPWHVTAFHKDYKMKDPENTPVRTLLKACEIGKKAGLHYVYAGNLPGSVGNWENTYCPSCHELLIKRFGFHVLQNTVKSGACPHCRQAIAGVWN